MKVVLTYDTIVEAIGCLHEGSTYQEGWEKNYDSHVTRALYKDNANKAGDQKTIVYNLMYEKVMKWNPSQQSGTSQDTILEEGTLVDAHYHTIVNASCRYTTLTR